MEEPLAVDHLLGLPLSEILGRALAKPRLERALADLELELADLRLERKGLEAALAEERRQRVAAEEALLRRDERPAQGSTGGLPHSVWSVAMHFMHVKDLLRCGVASTDFYVASQKDELWKTVHIGRSGAAVAHEHCQNFKAAVLSRRAGSEVNYWQGECKILESRCASFETRELNWFISAEECLTWEGETLISSAFTAGGVRGYFYVSLGDILEIGFVMPRGTYLKAQVYMNGTCREVESRWGKKAKQGARFWSIGEPTDRTDGLDIIVFFDSLYSSAAYMTTTLSTTWFAE